MAYASKDLSVLAYANGFTLWHYTTTDPAIARTSDQNGALDAGYFNDAADMLRVGDIIVANIETDGTPASGLYLVNSNTAGSVAVADMTAIGTPSTASTAKDQKVA